MDYKKKYEQALVNARQEYNTTVNVERKKWLEELFPELKETEAECVEKIKKDIISYLNNRQITSIAESNATARWLSWLEKQGEKEYTQRDIDDAYLKGIADAKREVEKQNEKKSSDEVLKIRQEIYQSGYNDGYKHGCEDTKKQGEFKPAWSEEDEQMILSIKQVMSCASLLNIVPEKIDKIKFWLKSLKERYFWKPSKEQMEAIRIAANVGTANDSWAMGILRDMYNDLKKLKEK